MTYSTQPEKVPRTTGRLMGYAWHYLLAVVAVAAAMGLRLALEAWIGHGLPSFITFYPALMVVVVVAGFGPGILATILMAITACYWILPPIGQFTIALPVDRLALTIFTGTNLFVCVLADLYRRNRDKASAYERETALRQSEERLALAASATQVGMFDWNLVNGRILWTQTHEEIFGYAPSATTTTTTTTTTEHDHSRWSDRVHPDDLPLIEEESRRCLRERTPLEVQYRIIWPDGTLHWIESKGVYQYENDGKASRMLGVVMDITGRKQAEEERRQTEEKFSIAFANNPAAIALTQLEDGIFIDVNNTWEVMSGYNRGEVIGRSARELPIWPTVEDAARFIQELQVHGSLRGWEQEFRRKSGELYVAELSAQVLIFGSKNVILSTLVDITERKNAERVLQNTLQRFYLMLSNMYSGVLLMSDDGRVEFINQAFCDAYGLKETPHDLVGLESMDLLEKILPAFGNPDEAAARIREILQRGEPINAEEFAMQGGRTALRDFVPLNINGKSSGRLWIYTDITEIKQAEKKLNIFATEIQAANTALRESRTSALNLMQDAIEARAVAEKANKDLLREVVERRRAEDALRENDQRFRLATEATGVGIWEWNVMTNQIRWDSQMFCIYGIAPTEDGYVQYSDWSGGVLPEDLPEQEAILHNTARHGGQSAREFRLRRREDGEYRTIQAVETVRLNAQGEIEWVVGTNLDVSERKRAEEALRRQTEAALHMSEQEFRSLAEAMPQIVWATRPDGWNIYFNQQWVDYTGLTMEESYGHGWITPFHPDDRQRAWDAWQRATQHIERYSMECRLRRADGVYRWWLIRGEPMRAENGEILKWFGTCTDIEELKLAEAELHEANAHLEQRVAERTAELRKGEERLQLAVSATNLGTWDYKPTTGALNWDARCKELFGLPPGTEVNYETFLTGLHPDDREHTHQVVQGAFDPASGGKYDIEYRSVGLTDGGRVRWIHATGQAFFNDAGQAVRFTGTVQDITESKRAEELIKASLAEKEIMLREIHHRVKNNLQVISSLVSLQADTLTDEEMRGEFNDVRDRVRSMALVHEKLYQTGDLAHMNFADYAASLLQYLWRSHGALAEKVRLNLKVASVTLPIESAVPCGLILNELAGNALKHAFPDNRCGEVTVGMEHDPVSGEVSLLVSDDGVGLPEGLEWRQARSLGLRLVQMLAGQLQGTVDTGPGPGAEFRVVFPLKGSNS